MPGSHPCVSEYTAKYQCIAVCGISKEKKFIDDIRQACELKVQVWERHFWCRGCYVDTMGRNKEKIAEYIRHQLDEDIMADQLSFKEYIDPFTGSKNPEA